MYERVDGEPLNAKQLTANAAQAAGIICRALSLAQYEHSEDEALALFDLLAAQEGEFPDADTLANNLDLFHTEGGVH